MEKRGYVRYGKLDSAISVNTAVGNQYISSVH